MCCTFIGLWQWLVRSLSCTAFGCFSKPFSFEHDSWDIYCKMKSGENTLLTEIMNNSLNKASPSKIKPRADWSVTNHRGPGWGRDWCWDKVITILFYWLSTPEVCTGASTAWGPAIGWNFVLALAKQTPTATEQWQCQSTAWLQRKGLPSLTAWTEMGRHSIWLKNVFTSLLSGTMADFMVRWGWGELGKTTWVNLAFLL